MTGCNGGLCIVPGVQVCGPSEAARFGERTQTHYGTLAGGRADARARGPPLDLPHSALGSQEGQL